MTFEIWEEGFVATGESAKARLLGTSEGEDFLDACKNYIARTGYGKIDPHYGPSNWCCSWYPTEKEAREAFG